MDLDCLLKRFTFYDPAWVDMAGGACDDALKNDQPVGNSSAKVHVDTTMDLDCLLKRFTFYAPDALKNDQPELALPFFSA
eukprot:CAMPEP_0194552802 /NCGR_PEP_ID=MMETSP0253-20130528/96910_1 /TAXON_ID=2966 /ORGANISM="Noctiluca scintillans" /LENGTH=79 /DNA_ID=CAMNT_0039400275 /DNA_START=391 /DNA_END=629 /DNA_ORIENTATION=-